MAALMFSKKVLQILKKHSNNNDKNINDWNTEDTIIRTQKEDEFTRKVSTVCKQFHTVKGLLQIKIIRIKVWIKKKNIFQVKTT